MLEKLYEWDCQTLLWVQEHLRSDALTPVMKFFTYLGNWGLLPIVVCILLLLFQRTRRQGALCAAALAGNALLVNVLLKNIIDRVRPYEKIKELELLISPQSDGSFPSGHAAACFSVAVVLLIWGDKKLSVPATAVAIIIAFSRIYVGVHYPSDVIAGIGAGIFAACVVSLTVMCYLKRNGRSEKGKNRTDRERKG